MGGQVTNPYPLTLDIGVPGQLLDENLDSKVLSFPAGENIGFGLLLEVDSAGNVHPVQGTSNVLTGGVGATSTLAGVSVFDVAREQQLAATGGSAGSGFYVSGEMVPVLRKGRILGAWDGSGTQTIFGRVNAWHPGASDPNGIRGVFTLASTQNTVSSEIAQTPAQILMVRDVSKSTPQRGGGNSNAGVATGPWTWVVALEVNLPGA